METIKFDVEKAMSGLYDVFDTNGNRVRIICWDYSGTNYPIIGLVFKKNEREYVEYYSTGGQSFVNDGVNLRLKPKVASLLDKQLTEFETAVGYAIWHASPSDFEEDPNELRRLKDCAAYLYGIAKRQILDGQGGHAAATTGDTQSATIPNVKEVCYDGLEKKDDYGVICEHITDTKLSDEVNTRLNNCGWFVCDKNNIRGLIECLAEIEKNM